MGGVDHRAMVLTIVFLLSFQLPLSNPSLPEETEQFFTDQEVISSTEVRVHNLGGDWDENQLLEWAPNHLEYNRTIQFSILIEGINSTESIESMTLNMTWIYNVSTGDPLLSENLSVSRALQPRRFSLKPSCHLAVVPLSSTSFSLLSLHPLSRHSPALPRPARGREGTEG